MSDSDRKKWDRKYEARAGDSPGAPAEYMEQLLRTLPLGGRALDLAAGDGANSLLLASRGWKVTAVDISAIGLQIGKRVAGPLPIDWQVADLDEYEPPAESFDLVICFRFFDHKRLPHIIGTALKPGGYFVGESFNFREGTRPGSHVTNPDYLVNEDEWLTLLPGFEILEHEQGSTTTRIFARKSAAQPG